MNRPSRRARVLAITTAAALSWAAVIVPVAYLITN